MDRTTRIPSLVGFHGPIGSGKTTAAVLMLRLVSNAIGAVRTERLSFALKMKQAAGVILNRAASELNKPEVKQEMLPYHDVTVREFLQKFGHGMREQIHPDIWVRALGDTPGFARASSGMNFGTIEDVRYENEFDLIHNSGGVVVGLRGNFTPEARRGTSGHPSEQQFWDKCDVVVDNLDTLDRLLMHLVQSLTFLGVYGECTSIQVPWFTLDDVATAAAHIAVEMQS